MFYDLVLFIMGFLLGMTLEKLNRNPKKKESSYKKEYLDSVLEVVDLTSIEVDDIFKEIGSNKKVKINRVFSKNIRGRRYSLVKYEFVEMPDYIEIQPIRLFLKNFIKDETYARVID